MDALTICVNYADYLTVSLFQNRKFFDRYLVITDTSDSETPKVCIEHGAECIKTDVFYENNAPFAKGRALDMGIKCLWPKWTAIVDADILIPPSFEELTGDLDAGAIYGPRYKHHCQYGETGSNLHHGGTACAGFLQMFYIGVDAAFLHPSTSGHCGTDDVLFSTMFHEVQYLDMTAYHMGPIADSGKDNINWRGRVSERCPYVVADIPLLLEGRQVAP